MHSAEFFQGDLEQVSFTLDGRVAEWLFASGFWRAINEKYHLNFDQYEEEEISPDVALMLSRELFSLVDSVKRMEPSIWFTRGWSVEGLPIKVEIERRVLIRKVDELARFMQSSASVRSTVSCML